MKIRTVILGARMRTGNTMIKRTGEENRAPGTSLSNKAVRVPSWHGERNQRTRSMHVLTSAPAVGPRRFSTTGGDRKYLEEAR